MPTHEPIAVADNIWWVGATLANDQFQCHAYFIDCGSDSVLIDPGSPLTVQETLAKVAAIADPASIRYLVCHHADPDVAASLPFLADRLTRRDAVVVTEWRAAALLKHYGHRFDYYLVEDHEWALQLGQGRSLEFQLTPYLHFPGAFVSYDPATATLFSSDLFGGFVPDSTVLVSHDLDYVIEGARPFHQHYMPSTALLNAGLGRIQRRWPRIDLIAPQHGHLIPAELVGRAFAALKALDCGVFALADADLDLQRLLRISEAKVQLTDALLTIASPDSLVAALDSVMARTHALVQCELYIDVPDTGWARWTAHGVTEGASAPTHDRTWVELPGAPAALLTFHAPGGDPLDEELAGMLQEMAHAVRPAIDLYLARAHEARQLAAASLASATDPLTGLGNRRALELHPPVGQYALLSLDLDHFKDVNDTFGHAAGDLVLRRVAEAVVAGVREADEVFRWGGEEFLVVLPDTDQGTALVIGERVRSAVAALDVTGYAPDGRITVSVGVANARVGSTLTAVEVLAQSDAAMYASKSQGRNRVTAQ